MNHADLAQKIKALDTLSSDEKAALIELLNGKKYGLVWENKPETVEEELRTQLPILHEVTEKRILGKSEKGQTEHGESVRTRSSSTQIAFDFSSNKIQLSNNESLTPPHARKFQKQPKALRPTTPSLKATTSTPSPYSTTPTRARLT
ncbi:hypothetical protein DR864_25680 [Runella rosea]|uniref:Uncharacterized protein n=1 Tax=Runella rosea TaxID=2259595 RepID=A0A344TQG5_9BACT|nr:hypothetical protein [Runella rosea]AXE20886.1 hypothetical protein DR864_25680 [Runella rosea]